MKGIFSFSNYHSEKFYKTSGMLLWKNILCKSHINVVCVVELIRTFYLYSTLVSNDW